MAIKKSAGNVDEQDAIASFLARKGIRDSKEITSSSWKWEIGLPKYFKVLGIPAQQRAKRPGEKMEPPIVCPVRDLETMEHKTLICNTMLHNQFQSIPPEQLIGKCFVSVMHAVEGKDYKGFDTREVPDPEQG